MAVLLAALKAAWAALGVPWASLRGWTAKPPGRTILIVVVAMLAVWWWSGHEYRAGQAACEAAHRGAAQSAILKQAQRSAAVVAASEARTAADTKIVYRNKEIVRDVAVEAATLPAGGAVCVPADLADRVRGLQ